MIKTILFCVSYPEFLLILNLIPATSNTWWSARSWFSAAIIYWAEHWIVDGITIVLATDQDTLTVIITVTVSFM